MFPAFRRAARRPVLFLAMLPVLLSASGCTPTQLIEFRDMLNQPSIFFGDFIDRPAVSPDGKLVAVSVSIHGDSMLTVIDADSGKLRIFAAPDDETWKAPAFAPDGRRIAFVRCSRRCVGRSGHHISLLDLETGRDTTVTTEVHRYRGEPVFSPDGRFVVYGSRYLARKGHWYTLERSYWRGVYTREIRVLDLETRIEHTLPLSKFGIEWSGPVVPEGFLDDGSLVIHAAWPERDTDPAWLEKLKAATGKSSRRPATYRIAFDRPFSSASPPPSPVSLDLLAIDWVKPGPRIGTSSDAGTMFARHGRRILVGNATKVLKTTKLPRYMTEAGISKSGNRVAFFSWEERLVRNLWVYDVATGKAWKTGLRERLTRLYIPDG